MRTHADFYRRQRILSNGVKYPVDPETEIHEAAFMRFWMSKLDYRQETFKKLPMGKHLQLETLIKIAEAVTITDRLNIQV